MITNVSLEELEAFVFATFSRQSRMGLLTEWGYPNFLERLPKCKTYSASLYTKMKLLKYWLNLFIKFNIILKNRGSFSCPICIYNGPVLNIRLRKNLCPNCGSVEIHRLQFLVFQKLCKHYDISQMSILHVVLKIFSKLFLRNNFESILHRSW